jgi:hypothetical protein
MDKLNMKSTALGRFQRDKIGEHAFGFSFWGNLTIPLSF